MEERRLEAVRQMCRALPSRQRSLDFIGEAIRSHRVYVSRGQQRPDWKPGRKLRVLGAKNGLKNRRQPSRQSPGTRMRQEPDVPELLA